MNYQKHYDLLISRSKHRTIIGYTEKHHIIPRCLGGSDDKTNLVNLTPEEHYVAHQLLVKIYPTNELLSLAALLMGTKGNRNNKLYGWIRRKVSQNKTGKPCSEETKQKLRIINLGKKHTTKTKQKMTGRLHTIETKEKISKAGIGRVFSDEVKLKISLALKGKKKKPLSEERKKEISIKMSGRTLSDETKQKMRKPKSSETKLKMRLSKIKKAILNDFSNKHILSSDPK